MVNKSQYPTNMIPLICDCRSLLYQDWELRVQHNYREVNECEDTLAKQGTHQRNLLTIYSDCPSFVYVCYIRDLAGLGMTRPCAQGSDIGDV